MRVLVVEDKRSMADLLRRALEAEGYTVSVAYDGDEALSLALSRSYQVILLDLMLPRKDGFEVIQRLREARRATAIIILSARDAMADIVRGLDLGADDYLTKPFVLDVLLARVRAAARRAPVTEQQYMRFGDLTLRQQTFELQRGSRVVSLTRTEYALLDTLMRRAGSVVPKSILIEEGWGDDADVSGATLYVFIRSLRSKITQPGESDLLHTARGIGYSLREEVC
jgi:two-component system response regulator MprA